MATRYFKKPNGHKVCTTSSGNRSKVQPDAPGYPYDWIEIDRTEFNRLRRQIESGRTLRATDAEDSATSQAESNAETLSNSDGSAVPARRS